MILGQFIQDRDGNFHGTIKAFGVPETFVIFAPQLSRDGETYYEIVGDPVNGIFDGGAAFLGKKGSLSVSLDSPLFPAPVNAELCQDEENPDSYNLVWNRAAPKPDTADEILASFQA